MYLLCHFILFLYYFVSFTASSKCVVWDLRKNESIIKISDSSRALRYKPVAWHPEVATQLCLASEDDHSPVIQIWDLRMASAPLKTLGMCSKVPKAHSLSKKFCTMIPFSKNDS